MEILRKYGARLICAFVGCMFLIYALCYGAIVLGVPVPAEDGGLRNPMGDIIGCLIVITLCGHIIQHARSLLCAAGYEVAQEFLVVLGRNIVLTFLIPGAIFLGGILLYHPSSMARCLINFSPVVSLSLAGLAYIHGFTALARQMARDALHWGWIPLILILVIDWMFQ